MAEPTKRDAVPGQQILYQKLAEIGSHNLARVHGEWADGWSCLIAINFSTRPADRARIYRDWLTGLSRRRIEDVAYAYETARDLAGIELKVSMGLTTTDDQEVARAA